MAEYLTSTLEAVKWPCLHLLQIVHIPHKPISQRVLTEEHSLPLRRLFLSRLINFFWNSGKVKAHSKSASAHLTSKLIQCYYRYLSLLCTYNLTFIIHNLINLNFSCTECVFKNQYFEISSFRTDCRSTHTLIKQNVLYINLMIGTFPSLL